MSEKRLPHPFAPEDAKARKESSEQFYENKERVSEDLHGESALRKYEPKESSTAEERGASNEEQAAEMKATLREKLLEEIENSPAKQIKVAESNLSREEYVEKLINPS